MKMYEVHASITFGKDFIVKAATRERAEEIIAEKISGADIDFNTWDCGGDYIEAIHEVYPTGFAAVKLLCKPDEIAVICEHLAMNGYTYDTNGESTLFIYDEELEYVLTILDDHDITYEIV